MYKFSFGQKLDLVFAEVCKFSFGQNMALINPEVCTDLVFVKKWPWFLEKCEFFYCVKKNLVRTKPALCTQRLVQTLCENLVRGVCAELCAEALCGGLLQSWVWRVSE